MPDNSALTQYVMWEPSYKTMYLGLFASLSAEFIHVIDEVWGYMDGWDAYTVKMTHIYIIQFIEEIQCLVWNMAVESIE